MKRVFQALHSRPALFRKTIAGYHASQSKTAATAADLPQMPPSDFVPEKYEGMGFQDAMKVRKENLSPALLTYYKNPVMITQGHKQWLYDVSGKRYLDMFAGIVTVSVGHCHERVKAAVEEQMKLLWHTTNIYLHPKIHEFSLKLAEKMPGDLKVCYFANSGSEANDLALFMARLHTGAYPILSFRNAYHGMSPYLMGVTAQSPWHFPVPQSFGVVNTMNPDVYRGPWGGSHCRDSPVQTTRQCSCSTGQCLAKDMYVEQLRDTLRHSCPKKIAGFFAEPIQGVGGTVQYPKGFLKEAFAVIREHGGVCIADEVQTGFGRLGSHYWGFQSEDVMPDIVTMAKGIGNGFPLAAVVTTQEIASKMSAALHFNTYGGNPLSCAVGLSVLEVVDDESLQENSSKVGTHLLLGLGKLRDKYEVLGDVRGKGLMIGMELVSDKESKVPLPQEDVGSIWEDTKDMGVLMGKGGLYGSVLRIKPPMCITMEDADFTISVIDKALDNYQNAKSQ